MIQKKYYASNKLRTYLYSDAILQIIIGFYDDKSNSIEYKHIWINGREIDNIYYINP